MSQRRDPRSTHVQNASADSHQRQDHQSGQEQSRQALEHSQQLQEHAALGDQEPAIEHDFAISLLAHEDLALRAYKLWEARGRPVGSPNQDWFLAVQELNGSGPDA